MLRDSIIFMVISQFETDLEMYIEATKYFLRIYISHRLQKYVNSRLFVTLISLDTFSN